MSATTKPVGVLNEWILFKFLALLNIVVGGYVGCFIVYGNLAVPAGYAFCTNQDPDLVFQPRIYDSTFTYFNYIIIITLLWHLVLKYKIRRSIISTRQNKLVNELISYWSVLIMVMLMGMRSISPPVKEEERPPIPVTIIVLNVTLGWVLPGYSYVKHKKIRKYYRAKMRRNHIIPVNC